MDIEQRKKLALEPFIWTGDLLDDCTAAWTGLMLRAEWMDEDWWWWAVYDMNRSELTIDSSNNYDERSIGGDAAREKAEYAAKEYLERISRTPIAEFLITDTFKITGRGLVFAGYIPKGMISVGDIIEFIAFEEILFKKIVGVESIRDREVDKDRVGLLIKCKNEVEIDMLRSSAPNKQKALVYKL